MMVLKFAMLLLKLVATLRVTISDNQIGWYFGLEAPSRGKGWQFTVCIAEAPVAKCRSKIAHYSFFY